MSDFSLFLANAERDKKRMFLWRKDVRAQSVEELQKSAAKGHKKEKRELARRLMEGDGMDEDEAKAVSLLEDCVDRGDTSAMLTLARYCAFGLGINQNPERAEALVSDAAKKRNDEARILMKLINDWKGKQSIDLDGLKKYLFKGFNDMVHVCSVFAGCLDRECTIECVALVMAIVPCQRLHLRSPAREKISQI